MIGFFQTDGIIAERRSDGWHLSAKLRDRGLFEADSLMATVEVRFPVPDDAVKLLNAIHSFRLDLHARLDTGLASPSYLIVSGMNATATPGALTQEAVERIAQTAGLTLYYAPEAPSTTVSAATPAIKRYLYHVVYRWSGDSGVTVSAAGRIAIDGELDSEEAVQELTDMLAGQRRVSPSSVVLQNWIKLCEVPNGGA